MESDHEMWEYGNMGILHTYKSLNCIWYILRHESESGNVKNIMTKVLHFII